MRKPKKVTLFKAYIRYGETPTSIKIYTLENCFLIQGKLAQLYKMRIRPVFVNLPSSSRHQVFEILKKSKGSITIQNYKQLLPLMVGKGKGENNVEVYDLDDEAGPSPNWLFLHKAINL